MRGSMALTERDAMLLLTLAPGLLELAEAELLPPAVFAGLRDACRILREAWRAEPALDELERMLAADPPATLRAGFAARRSWSGAWKI